MPSRKTPRTVFARLLELTLMAVTKREWPSTNAWVTIFHLIKPNGARANEGERGVVA